MSGDNIKVAIRVRPLIEREHEEKAKVCWSVEENVIRSVDRSDTRCNDLYAFDHIFGTEATNKQLYDEVVMPLVLTCVEGYHCTIFAYGQTSSGKTHTMDGTRVDPGIIPRVVDQLFQIINERKNFKFLIRVAYVEIYNEKIYDLLSKRNTEVKVREDSQGNITVCAEELVTSTKDQVLELMNFGKKNRKIHSTRMNIKSSRSHTIFRIIVECTENSSDGVDLPVKVSHFNLVDLAGSERVSQTKATGQRLVEGSAINKSLSTLTFVISQLADQSKFMNYRDSKLTLILKNALGGNAKTLIIANVTPASLDDTHSTLSFARRAKSIKNQPVINTTGASVLSQCQMQINKLKSELRTVILRNKNLTMDNAEAMKTVEILRERIKLNYQAFAKPETTHAVVKRRHTIGQTKNIAVADEFQNILTKDWTACTDRIPMTAFEACLLQVVRTNAQEHCGDQPFRQNVLPFQAHFLNVSQETIVANCKEIEDEIQAPQGQLSFADYTLDEVDSEIGTDDDDQEFVALEKAIIAKETTNDLRNELAHFRSELNIANTNYAQQIFHNKFQEKRIITLSNELIKLKMQLSLEKEQCQLFRDKMSELETKLPENSSSSAYIDLKKRYENLLNDVDQKDMEYFKLLKHKTSLDKQVQELTNNSKSTNPQPRLVSSAITDSPIVENLRLEIANLNQKLVDEEEVRTQLTYKHKRREEELLKRLAEKATPKKLFGKPDQENCTHRNGRKQTEDRHVSDIVHLDEENCVKTPNDNPDFSEENDLQMEIKQYNAQIDSLNEKISRCELQILELSNNLKIATVNLETTEDQLLETSEELSAKEKELSLLQKEFRLCKISKDFNQNYYDSKLNDINSILLTFNEDATKKLNSKRCRTRSLSSIDTAKKLCNPILFSSLHNIALCAHEPSLREIVDDLTNLNRLLLKTSSAQNLQPNDSLIENSGELYNLKQTVQDKINNLAELEGTLDEIKTRNVLLESQLQDCNKKMQGYEKEIQIYQKQTKGNREVIESLESQIQNYSIEGDNLEHLKTKIDGLESKVKSYIDELNSKENKLISKENEYKILEVNFANQKREYSKLAEERVTWLKTKEDLIEMQQKSQHQLKEIENFKEHINDLEEKLRKQEKNYAEIVQEYQSLIHTERLTRSEFKTLEDKFENKKIEHVKISNELKSIQEKYNMLGKEYDKILQKQQTLVVRHEDFTMLEQTLGYEQTERLKISNELKNIEGRRDMLQKEYNEIIQKQESLVFINKELHNKLGSEQERILKLNDELKSIHERYDLLKEEYNKIIQNQEQSYIRNEELKILQEKFEYEQNERLKISQEFKGVQEKYDILQKEYNEIILKKQNQRSEMSPNSKSLEKQHNILIGEYEKLIVSNKQLQNKLNKFPRLLQERDDYINTLKVSSKSNHTKTVQLESDKTCLTMKVKSLEKTINDKSQANSTLQEQLKIIEGKYDMLKKEHDAAIQNRQEECSDLTLNFKKLEKQHNTLAEEHEELILTNKQMRSELDKFPKHLQERDDYINTLKASSELNHTKTVQLESDKTCLTMKLKSLEKNVNDKSQATSTLQEQLKIIQGKYDILKKEQAAAVQHKQEECSELTLNFKKLEKQHNTLIEEYEKLISTNKQMQTELDKFPKQLQERDDYMNTLKASFELNHTKTVQLESDKTCLTMKLNSLEKTINDKCQANSTLQEQLKIIEGKYDMLKKEHDAAIQNKQEECSDLTLNFKKLEQQHNTLTEEHEKLILTNKQMRRELDKFSKHLQERDDHINTLKGSSKLNHTKIVQLESDKTCLTMKLKSLEKNINDKSQITSTLQEQLKIIQGKYDILKKEQDAAKQNKQEECSDLILNFKKLEKQHNTLIEEHEKLISTNKQMRSELDKSCKHLQERDDYINTLKASSELNHTKTVQLELDKTCLTMKLNSLEKTINDKSQANSTFQEQLKIIEGKYDMLKKEHDAAIQNKQEECSDLTLNFKKLEKQHNTLTEEHEKLISTNKQMRRELDKFSKHLRERDDHINTLKGSSKLNHTKIVQLESDKTCLTMKLKSLEKNINDKSQITSTLQEQLKIIQGKYDILKKEQDAAKQNKQEECSDLILNFKKLEKQHNTLTEEHEKLILTNKQMQRELDKLPKLLQERGTYINTLKTSSELNHTKTVQLESDKTCLTMKVKSLEQIINEKTEAFTKLGERFAAVRNLYDNLSHASEHSKAACRSHLQENCSMRVNIQELQYQTLELENELKKYKLVNASLQELQEKSYQDKCTSLKADVTEEINMYKTKYASAAEQNKFLIDKINHLEKYDTGKVQTILKDRNAEIERMRKQLQDVEDRLNGTSKELRKIRSRCVCEASSSSPSSMGSRKQKRRCIQDNQRDTACTNCDELGEKIKSLETKIFNIECQQLVPHEPNQYEVYYQCKAEVQKQQIEKLQMEYDKSVLEKDEILKDKELSQTELKKLQNQYTELSKKYDQVKVLAHRSANDVAEPEIQKKHPRELSSNEVLCQRRVEAQTAQTTTLQTEQEKLRSEINRVLKENEGFQSQLENLQEQHTMLSRKYELTKAIARRRANEIATLESQLKKT